MLHKNRKFKVFDVASPQELREKLHERTNPLCYGFRLGGYLWLNDSICEDGAQEYAVVREKLMVQVESITVSWASMTSLLVIINDVCEGEYLDVYDSFPGPSPIESHETCRLCR